MVENEKEAKAMDELRQKETVAYIEQELKDAIQLRVQYHADAQHPIPLEAFYDIRTLTIYYAHHLIKSGSQLTDDMVQRLEGILTVAYNIGRTGRKPFRTAGEFTGKMLNNLIQIFNKTVEEVAAEKKENELLKPTSLAELLETAKKDPRFAVPTVASDKMREHLGEMHKALAKCATEAKWE